VAAFKPVFPDCGIDFKVEVVLFLMFCRGGVSLQNTST